VDLIFLRSFCQRNFGTFAFVPSIGRSGGIITIWGNTIFTGHTVFHNRYALSLELHSTKSDIYWTSTNIYAPYQNGQQLEYLQWIHNIHISADQNWLLLGGFNLIRSPQDSNRPEGNVNEMLLLNEAISDIGLVDIPLKGRRFIWSNMENNPLLQRLDGRLIFKIQWLFL
jgi:hypothetical protein